MKIIIASVNGFIAKNLARYLQKKDCKVYETSSNVKGLILNKVDIKSCIH